MERKTFQNTAQHFPIIAIMGVDGSGKTTIIEEIRKRLQDPYNIEVCSIHRSKGRSEITEIAQHYAKPAYSPFLSVIKLFVKAFLWILNYWSKYRKLQQQGALILCDLYYFYSMAIDPLRYRYGGPTSLVWEIHKIVPKPQVYIFLDAPFEVLVSRKRELPDDEMHRLIKDYRELFANIPNAYIVDATQPIDKVTSDVLQIIMKYAVDTSPK